MPRLRTLIVLFLGLAFAVFAMLFVGSLGQLYPGNPIVAAVMAVVFFGLGILALRTVFAGRSPEREEQSEPEDVIGLDVFFVCGLCGTEFRVEKIGELQVPRHCGELMNVERRPRTGGWPPG